MFKFAMTIVLSLSVFAAVAASDRLTTASTAQKLPVIMKNEIVASGTCRLHFADHSTKDVACKTVSE